MSAVDHPPNGTNKTAAIQTKPTCPHSSRNSAWYTPKITSSPPKITTDLTKLITFCRHKTTGKTTRNTTTICQVITNRLATLALALMCETTAAITFQRITSGRAANRQVQHRITNKHTIWGKWDLYNTTIKRITRTKMWKKIITNKVERSLLWGWTTLLLPDNISHQTVHNTIRKSWSMPRWHQETYRWNIIILGTRILWLSTSLINRIRFNRPREWARKRHSSLRRPKSSTGWESASEKKVLWIRSKCQRRTLTSTRLWSVDFSKKANLAHSETSAITRTEISNSERKKRKRRQKLKRKRSDCNRKLKKLQTLSKKLSLWRNRRPRIAEPQVK